MAPPWVLDETGNVDPPEDFGNSSTDSGSSTTNVAADPTKITASGGLSGSTGLVVVPYYDVAPYLNKPELTGAVFSTLVGPAGNPVNFGQIYVVLSMFVGSDETYFSKELGPFTSTDSNYIRIDLSAILLAHPEATKIRAYFRNVAGVFIPAESVNYQEWSRATIIGLGNLVTINTLANATIQQKLLVGTFDWEDFNTESDCSYYYRQEDLMPGRHVTVSRIRIVYRDLGAFTLTASVLTAQVPTANSDSTKGDVNSQTKTFGGKADSKLYTDYFDFVTSGERPQLVLTRKALDGPVSIISATMITDVEVMEQT